MKILNWLFPKKSKWVDIGCYERMGTYYLIQGRRIIYNNKKEFRTTTIGFINDYTEKVAIYNKAKTYE